MKLLWITNILLPEAVILLTGNSNYKGSGGWLLSSAQALVGSGEVQLSIVTVSSRVGRLTKLSGKNIDYYILPHSKNMKDYELFMKEIAQMVNPNIIHIHGTEWPYGLAYMTACGSDKVVISIQGLLGVIANCYTEGLSRWEIIRNITFRDLFLKTIFGEKKDYRKRAIYEAQSLRKAKHVIGRTSFDHKFVMSINPNLKYHFCNESLRDEFYQARWKYQSCTPHTIFLSQANYPIKGLHQIIKALPIVRQIYPDVRIRVAGNDITSHRTMSDIMKYSGYGKIICRLISKYHLADIVSFTGLLSAQEMVNEFLHCNLYICPSSCENSSNSIAEAQILGVPCLVSNRGGNPDMIPDTACGKLYEFDDIEELASSICEIFESSSLFDNSHVRTMARNRHDKVVNLHTTLNIYKSIISE